MKKKVHFSGRCPKEKLDQLFTQWTTNAASLSLMYPEDQHLEEVMETMVRTFDAVLEQYTMQGVTTVIVMWQPRIPDFETSDEEYGEIPL